MWAGDMEKCQSNTDMQDISTEQRYDINVQTQTTVSKKNLFQGN
jgi:hypothetical protein